MRMLGEKIETIIIALSICFVSIVVLVGGMNLSAMRSNKTEEILDDETNLPISEDVIDSVISEFSEDSLREEFSGVNIITWDEYYELSGLPVKEEDRKGIYGTINEDNCSMEWAGLLALKEISYMEDIDMEGMYLMMALSEATYSQTVDIWRGYLCDSLAGEAVGREYYVQVNAYTGEVLRIEKRATGKELRTLFENSTKLEVMGKDYEIDYSAVPVITVDEYWESDTLQEKGAEYYRFGAEGYIPMQDAADILLREINYLFNENMMGMKLVMSFNDGKWGGWLLNEYDLQDERYKSYSFRMDARTGRIWWLTGGLNYVTYTQNIEKSDEEIVTNARSIIKKFHLAKVDKLNWSNVLIYNASKEMGGTHIITENPEERITDYIEFYSDDGELVRVSTDWETGELWMVLYKDYVYLYE